MANQVVNLDGLDFQKIGLFERATAPAATADVGQFYAKEVSGETELFYIQADGTEIQVTSGTGLNVPSSGWQDDGTRVRPVTITDQILVGQSSYSSAYTLTAGLAIVNINSDDYLIEMKTSDATGGFFLLRNGTGAAASFQPIWTGRANFSGSVGTWFESMIDDAHDALGVNPVMKFQAVRTNYSATPPNITTLNAIANKTLFSWYNNVTEVMRIDPGPKMGINNASPDRTLDVFGIIRSSPGSVGCEMGNDFIRPSTDFSPSLKFTDAAGANTIMSVDSINRRIGIRTNLPDHPFDSRTEISIFGESAALARVRWRGFYAANPSDPPTNQADAFIFDDGVTIQFRIRYNDAGVMKQGTVTLA